MTRSAGSQVRRQWGSPMSYVSKKLRELLNNDEKRRASYAPSLKSKAVTTPPLRPPSWQTASWQQSGWGRTSEQKALQISRQPKYGGGVKKRKKTFNRSTISQRPACEVLQLNKLSYQEVPNGPLLSGLIHGSDLAPASGMIREFNGITGEPNHIFTHQCEAVETFCQRLRKMRWIVNGADMGLGKTLMSILLYSIYCVRATKRAPPTCVPLRAIDRTGGWKMLVVGPKSMPTGWFDEFQKWTWLESENILIEESSRKLEDSIQKCLDDDDSEVAVVITTYDIVRLTYVNAYEKVPDPEDARRTVWRRKGDKPLPALFRWMQAHNERLVVSFDESHHRLRNHESQTTEAHAAMMRFAPNSKGLLTSGTACCNRPSDLMSQMRAIGDTSEYTEPDAWYPDKRDHKVVSTDAINYWREHMVSIPKTVLSLPELKRLLWEPDTSNDTLIPWVAYQTLVDEARGACTFNASETMAQRREKSVKLIAALRKLDLILIHPDLLRYDAKTLRIKENSELFDRMANTPTVYLSAVVEVVLDTFQRGERSMIVTSESVTVLHLLQRVIDLALATRELKTKSYFYVGSLDMTARLKVQHAFGHAANSPIEANPTTMHICYLSMQAGANGITLLGPRTMLKVPPGSFNPAISRQVDCRFHRIGVKDDVRVITMRVHGSAAHAIAVVNDDKKYLSELTTNLNTLGDDDHDSFGCTPLDVSIADKISWKVKGTYAQNLWDYNLGTKKLTPPPTAL